MRKILAFLTLFITLSGASSLGADFKSVTPLGTLSQSAQSEAKEKMRIVIKNKNGEFVAILDDTKTARSFAAQLPLTLNLEDYANHEKVAKLKTPLDVSEAPRGADGKKGEISYFAPWKNFVIYYGYQPYYDGIVRLGEILHAKDIEKIAIDGEITIELAK